MGSHRPVFYEARVDQGNMSYEFLLNAQTGEILHSKVHQKGIVEKLFPDASRVMSTISLPMLWSMGKDEKEVLEMGIQSLYTQRQRYLCKGLRNQ